MGVQRIAHLHVRLTDGRVLVAGGGSSAQNSAAELYDPAVGTWTATGNMTTPRVWQGLALLPGGQVLAVGGRSDGAPGGYVSSAELYDPATGIWSAAASMSFPRGLMPPPRCCRMAVSSSPRDIP